MCTVTVIPIAGGLRLVSNRDELRTRPPSSTAREHEVSSADGAVRALWPVDPTGGGTWVGVNERGLAMTLLNLNLDPHPALPADPLSRGVVITSVAHCAGAHEAADLVGDLQLERMNCFRLVLADTERVLCLRWDRGALTIDEHPLEPLCFASSGLGDHLVQSRLALWHAMLDQQGVSPDTQDAFHAHRWPERGFESVLMDREEARTTSTTVVEVGGARVLMRHRDDDDWHTPLHLPRRADTPATR